MFHRVIEGISTSVCFDYDAIFEIFHAVSLYQLSTSIENLSYVPLLIICCS
jgi:hypothetical protein